MKYNVGLWIKLAWDRVQWRAATKVAVSLISINGGVFLVQQTELLKK